MLFHSYPSYLFLWIFALTWTSCDVRRSQYKEAENGALEAMREFAEQRRFPNDSLPGGAYFDAFVYVEKTFRTNTIRSGNNAKPWRAIGPWNTAGRTLALAVHPDQPHTIWAGSASGGLWKTDRFGSDTSWVQVPTGFPVSGVSSIALPLDNKDVILIGTGEVYNYDHSGDGAAYRSVRGTSGIGILKSIDGGARWNLVLDWSRNQNLGVNHIAFGTSNTQVVYAATTSGVFVSKDKGDVWTRVLDVPMAMDLVVDPANAENAVVGCGNFNSTGKGIYYTENGGQTWQKSRGVPSGFNGKIRLDWVRNGNRNILYASIGDGFSTSGPTGTWTLRSMDNGKTWKERSTFDYSLWQGWFAHDIAAHPDHPDTVIAIGIYAHKSIDGAMNFSSLTENPQVTRGRPPVSGPDGHDKYTHVDHHAIIYHPTHHDTVLMATDGGVFFSGDGGSHWESRNGGLQTVQFYNGVSMLAGDEQWVIGGLQDNNSVLYDGDFAWTRVNGGDGGWSAIASSDRNTVFASSQGLRISKSIEAGRNFRFIFQPDPIDATTFIAPYVLHPTRDSILYAGSNYIYQSLDRGDTWKKVNHSMPLNGQDPAYCMQVAPSDPYVLYVGLAPFSGTPSVWVTQDGGKSFVEAGAGVFPERYPVDIDVDPDDAGRAIVVYGGFGTGHVFITEDFGASWADITGELPDLPTNAVAWDTHEEEVIYVGNDLGVFYTEDGGSHWIMMDEGLPEAVIVSDLKVSVPTRTLLVATHGNGMYQTELVTPLTTSVLQEVEKNFKLFPTVVDRGQAITLLSKAANGHVLPYQWIDMQGRVLEQGHVPWLDQIEMSVPHHVGSGIYILQLGLQTRTPGSRGAFKIVIR